MTEFFFYFFVGKPQKGLDFRYSQDGGKVPPNQEAFCGILSFSTLRMSPRSRPHPLLFFFLPSRSSPIFQSPPAKSPLCWTCNEIIHFPFMMMMAVSDLSLRKGKEGEKSHNHTLAQWGLVRIATNQSKSANGAKIRFFRLTNDRQNRTGLIRATTSTLSLLSCYENDKFCNTV